jgi:predicted acetyltransferase
MRTSGDVTVEELVAASPAAYARLWQHCTSIDLTTTVRAGDRAVDELLPWLLEDGRAVSQAGRFDFVWVRILDVAAALSARHYDNEGALVIDVHDDLGLAACRVALHGGPDGATCTPSEQTPDLVMPVDALGSLYAGGVATSTLAAAGRVVESTPGAVARADTMFRSVSTPWCSTWF